MGIALKAASQFRKTNRITPEAAGLDLRQ